MENLPTKRGQQRHAKMAALNLSVLPKSNKTSKAGSPHLKEDDCFRSLDAAPDDAGLQLHGQETFARKALLTSILRQEQTSSCASTSDVRRNIWRVSPKNKTSVSLQPFQLARLQRPVCVTRKNQTQILIFFI